MEVGELVEALVNWDDPAANLRVFLRDETTTLIERDIDGSGGSGKVSAVAETSGRWSIALENNSGSVNFDVLVDTTLQ